MGTKSAMNLNNHSDYSDYSLQLNRWFLKPIGVWPKSPSTTRLEIIASRLSNIICYGFLVSLPILSLLHLLLEDETLYATLKTTAGLSHWFASSVNYTILLVRSEDIRYCVQQIENDWRTVATGRHQGVMLQNAKFGRYVATVCAAFMQFGVMSFCVVQALTTEVIQIGNETRIVHVLPCTVYKRLVNVDENPTNAIVLYAQIFSIFIANSSTVGTFSLAAVLAAHACGQLDVLMVRINEFVETAGDKKRTVEIEKIGMIVEHHLRTLNFVTCIEKVMNRLCFVELFRCMLAVCLIGYMFLMDLADRNFKCAATLIACLVAVCLNVFIMCYIGEKLTEQCRKVGDIVYMTNWYYLPDKVILDLILVIARSSIVVNITAGKVIQMSVDTFGQVIKTGFAYLNVMRQMMR
ncbi:uncharacterized protein LOC143429288 [Xylocopa sonorina]|uniref:uncharacterized protein LOC143429288 n=1 Tax=Xylocopa sonorina TaxID=1818115 RepID=UPI00403ABE71